MKRLALCGAALCCAMAWVGCGGETPPRAADAQDAAGAPETPSAAAAEQKIVGAAMLTKTHIFYRDMVEAMQPQAREKLVAMIPAGRVGDPDEIARTIEFIFENDYLNGRSIDVDGGLRL